MRRRAWALVVGVLGASACGDDGAATPSDTSTTGPDVTETSEESSTSSTTSATSGADTTTDTGEPDAQALDEYCARDHVAVEAQIDTWLAALDVPSKVAMMHGIGLLPSDGTWVVAGNDALGIPGLHMLDGPRGVSQVSGVTATAFPVGMMRGATWDPELEREVGAAMAREIRSVGADVLLAPTMNLLRHPRWGRAQETYGEDTEHVGAMAVAFIEGAQSQDVIATAKHFAVNSIEDTRFDVNVTLDERTLQEVYLPHFRRAVQDADVAAVMSAYNSVNGAHCDVNAPLLRDILGDQWGFVGFVMSDWVQGTHGSVTAVRAGLDIEMPSGANFFRLVDEVGDGSIDEAELDESLRGVLRAQLCYGLDTDPAQPDADARETEEHLALAEEVARRGIVLVHNPPGRSRGLGVLPLDRAMLGEVIVMGPLADIENIGDDGSSAVDAADVVTALEGLVDRAGAVTITHLPSTSPTPDDEAAIMAADVVVLVVGLGQDDEGEGLIAGGDRESLALPAEQLALVHDVAALGTPTIVVLEGGGPILVSEWIDEVDAVMLAWYPGQRGGNAIADVIFGDAEPSGRLPASVPVAEADLPPFDNVALEVTYEYLHGYRHLAASDAAAALPFGFGLSYTELTYDAIAIEEATDDAVRVRVDVTNVGTRPGRETVQLYASLPDSAVMRAPLDLRGFAQVEVAAGDTASVEITVRTADLRTWDAEAGAWAPLEAGTYVLRAGPSSATLPLQVEVELPTGG
jgi:beta-glucosidase